MPAAAVAAAACGGDADGGSSFKGTTYHSQTHNQQSYNDLCWIIGGGGADVIALLPLLLVVRHRWSNSNRWSELLSTWIT
jgi:hypothetical protein